MSTKLNRSFIIIILLLIVVIIFILNWLHNAVNDKTRGIYDSFISISESKKAKVWISTYQPNAKKYYSSDKKDYFELKECWVETNNNDKEIYWEIADYNYILTLSFKKTTNDNLHKFRLINPPYKSLFNTNPEQTETPDGWPRIRFVLSEIKDTIQLEVAERNPKDSLNWMTKKIVDTITLIRRK